MDRCGFYSKGKRALASVKQKESMSSFDLAAIVHELQDVIIGSRLGNIYQTGPTTFLLAIQPDHKLLIELGRRIHLTKYVTKIPKYPSQFCMILRRHLRRGIINGVDMPGFERVIRLTIASKEAAYTLVFELFSKGNVILLSDEEAILYASSYRKMRDRSIIRGEVFQLPPPRGKDPSRIQRQDLDDLTAGKGSIARALSRHLAIGGVYPEEILLRAQIDKDKPARRVERREVDRIYKETTALVSSLSRTPQPHIVFAVDGAFLDVVPVSLTLYREHAQKAYPTFNEAADDYFTELHFEATKGGVQDQMLQQVAGQRRILTQQRERLRDLEQTARENQRVGDVIYAHTRELEALSRFVLDTRKNKTGSTERLSEVQTRATAFLGTDVLKAIDFGRGVFTVELDGFAFDVSFRTSVYANAARFYEDAKKAHEKIQGVKEAIAKTEKRMKVLAELEAQTEAGFDEPKRRRKRRWFEKFHWMHSHDGVLIIGGRDATSNELLLKKYTTPDDIVLHADLPGAPFVVIKTEGIPPSAQTLEEAAQCAVSYSRAWQGGYTSLNAYWVTPDQVSKTAPSGEYLTKGAFMIRGQKQYLRNMALRLSIGVVQTNDQWTVIGGAPSAIQAHTPYHIELIPGRQRSGRLAQDVRRRLANTAPPEAKTEILKLPLEEVQRFIPAGGGELELR
ncbi:hypothetical protein AC480_00275 [miscellaneous Crenarchaeota group archaeon SMTZ1-55]|nr:MAG: hypothetical protein AC480_00275 [miscellaneous Crenarchaeota group archaeon SMTZ1-55]